MINRLLQLETKRNDRKEKTTNLLLHYRLSRQPRRTASSERSNRTLSHQSNNNFHINHTHFENTGDLGNPIGSSQCDVLANPFSFGSKSLIQEIQSKKNISIKCSNSNRLFFLLKKGLVARRKKKKKKKYSNFQPASVSGFGLSNQFFSKNIKKQFSWERETKHFQSWTQTKTKTKNKEINSMNCIKHFS